VLTQGSNTLFGAIFTFITIYNYLNNKPCYCWGANHMALSGITTHWQAACWWWLFQMWKFWQFACLQYGFN